MSRTSKNVMSKGKIQICPDQRARAEAGAKARQSMQVVQHNRAVWCKGEYVWSDGKDIKSKDIKSKDIKSKDIKCKDVKCKDLKEQGR